MVEEGDLCIYRFGRLSDLFVVSTFLHGATGGIAGRRREIANLVACAGISKAGESIIGHTSRVA